MSAASWALQQAIFATLTADSAVLDAVGDPPRLFDAVPRGTAFPYIVIGDDKESDWSTATEPGSAHALTIHIWSRAAGRRETRLAAEAVIAALNGAELVIDGQTLIDLRWLESDSSRESDGETVHAQLKFRAVLEPQT
ncbi:MAG TPA: DUF3168 domain-containing protein [Rhizomicrobium sp.]|jgi:hypothetical protein|nr:DUF3168 domain-containing protein [Rhizomicrobium sp.]